MSHARDAAKKVLLDFFSHFEDSDDLCDNWAESILADMARDGLTLSLHPVIETVEQLDALPPGSVVLEAMGRYGDFLGITTIPGVFHKFPAPVEGWYVVAGHGARESTSIELPARVLYTPDGAK